MLRGQPIANRIASPAACGQRTEAIWRAKPHRSISPLRNRRHRVRRQTVRSRVSCEMAIPEFANTTVERPGPDCSVATQINRIDAVLSEAVGLRVCPGRDRAVNVVQMSQSTALSSNPQVILPISGDGIDNIVDKSSGRDCPVFSSFQPAQTTIDG